MDAKDIAAAELQLKQLTAKCLDNGVALILLDMEIDARKAYPGTVDVDPYARKIVAYLREHMVKP
jgi:hypothetical protein